MRRARVQEERELRGELGGERELGREGVQLERGRAVVQAVVVEAEFAEGDEGGAGGGDEGAEVGEDCGGAGGAGGGDGFRGRGGGFDRGAAGACEGVGGFFVVFALGLVVVVVVGGGEDGGAAGVDAGGGVDGVGWGGVSLGGWV